jgi:hypothetical protein
MFDHQLERCVAAKLINAQAISELNLGGIRRGPVFVTDTESNRIDNPAVIAYRAQHHLKVIITQAPLLLQLEPSMKARLWK